jgi:hypothetical protein
MEYQNNLNISNRLSYQKKPNGNLTTTVIGDVTSQIKNEYDSANSTMSKAALAMGLGKPSLCNETQKISRFILD